MKLRSLEQLSAIAAMLPFEPDPLTVPPATHECTRCDKVFHQPFVCCGEQARPIATSAAENPGERGKNATEGDR